MSKTPSQHAGDHRHRSVALCCAALVVVMVGAAFAAVPLYRLFCAATGFAGTPQRVAAASDGTVDKTITIRFDANVTPGLPWRFEPVEATLEVKVGENALAFYRATNLSDHTVTGMATFNVTPVPAGGFIDPQIVKDRDGRSISLIVLSYTFYPVNAKPSLVGKASDGSAGGPVPPAPGAAMRRGTAG